MNIGILGTGRVTQTLRRHWLAAGHDVTYDSRAASSKDALDAAVEGLAATLVGNELVVNANPGASGLNVAGGLIPVATVRGD